MPFSGDRLGGNGGEQLFMNTAKTTIAHDQDVITRLGRGRNILYQIENIIMTTDSADGVGKDWFGPLRIPGKAKDLIGFSQAGDQIIFPDTHFHGV